jgi:hypothetical protein
MDEFRNDKNGIFIEKSFFVKKIAIKLSLLVKQEQQPFNLLKGIFGWWWY